MSDITNDADSVRRQRFLTAIAEGEDRATAAKTARIPVSEAETLLTDPSALARIAGDRAELFERYRLAGAYLVASALETLHSDDVDASHYERALKIALASGILESNSREDFDPLESRIRTMERADRLRFLMKLEAAGLSEPEWRALYGLPPADAPNRKRNRKR